MFFCVTLVSMSPVACCKVYSRSGDLKKEQIEVNSQSMAYEKSMVK